MVSVRADSHDHEEDEAKLKTLLEGAVLYHIPKSSSSPVVQLVHELSLQSTLKIDTLTFEFVRKSDDYAANNPMRTVPALLLKDGTLITESGAIIDLILHEAGGLTTTSPVARAKMMQLLFFSATTVFPLASVTYLEWLKEKVELQDTYRMQTSAMRFTGTVAPFLKSQLGKNDYFLQEYFSGPTAVDFMLAKPLGNAEKMGWLEAFPEIKAFLQRIRSRESYAAAYE
mmetsp:Transcript_5560/g.12105  ORF Transcript_5560/g.12105 Transcript_5560/m.12105 type:complete len:228 (-) Transcript_5560:477-1160(-)|eukprot:5765733-Pleurochrysis_carterae.AAC.3